MLERGERWIGPFRIRNVLEGCLDRNLIPAAPNAHSAYLVSQYGWRETPSRRSRCLYVGGNTGKSERFRTRLGDLLADAFGFFNTNRIGHHSGGMSIFRWCNEKGVNPLDLHIAWIEGTKCARCLEGKLHSALAPELNRATPSSCPNHRKRSARGGR